MLLYADVGNLTSYGAKCMWVMPPPGEGWRRKRNTKKKKNCAKSFPQPKETKQGLRIKKLKKVERNNKMQKKKK